MVVLERTRMAWMGIRMLSQPASCEHSIEVGDLFRTAPQGNYLRCFPLNPCFYTHYRTLGFTGLIQLNYLRPILVRYTTPNHTQISGHGSTSFVSQTLFVFIPCFLPMQYFPALTILLWDPNYRLKSATMDGIDGGCGLIKAHVSPASTSEDGRKRIIAAISG